MADTCDRGTNLFFYHVSGATLTLAPITQTRRTWESQASRLKGSNSGVDGEYVSTNNEQHY